MVGGSLTPWGLIMAFLRLWVAIVAVACATLAPVAFAQAVAQDCLDAIKEDWRDINVDRTSTHHVFREHAAEAIDDFWGDSIIMQWYWDQIWFYTGKPKGRYWGTYYHKWPEKGCKAAIIRRGKSRERTEGDNRQTYLHELGHHISSGYLQQIREKTVREKHADFWSGAIAYRISKNEQGWTAHDLFHGRDKVVSDVGSEKYDRVFAFKEGWAAAEYGDTWLPYYGTWDEKNNPWLWEPQRTNQGQSSLLSLSSDVRPRDFLHCAHTHDVRRIDTLTRREPMRRAVPPTTHP